MKTKKLDLMGLGAAIICLIHCLLLPMLLTIPLGILDNAYLDTVFLLVGGLIVFRITKSIEYHWLRYLFWTAIVFIACSILIDLIFDQHSSLIYIGAGLLISAHLINIVNHKH